MRESSANRSSSKRRVTRTEVARVAGTSVAVVSYVINGGPRPVSPETRDRVLEAIQTTGYRPNVIAQALARGETRSLGLVVPNISNQFLSSLAREIGVELFSQERVMILADSADSMQQQKTVTSQLIEQRVSALLFYGVDDRHEFLLDYSRQVPIVVLDDSSDLPGLGYVRVHEREAARLATAHLLNHGYEEVAIITGPLQRRNSLERKRGWQDALDAAACEWSEQLVYEADFTREGGYHAARALFSSPRVPRALFVSNEQQALGLLAAANAAGIRIPQDLAVVCFNGTLNSEFSIPALTAVEQPLRDIAVSAVEMATRPVFQAESVLHGCRLVQRESCGCTVGNRVGQGEAEHAFDN
jgi:LacI family transcriptional regulator